jgi:glycosyltransferase involved in cell wall biosynthesis
MTNFSVLMSIYYKETASNLNQCLESLAIQTLLATEIIIVKDGKLTDELEKCLEMWQERLSLKIVGYEENKGLAYALNYGLQYCSCEFIARMDSDDICLPERFEKEVTYLGENLDVALVSGYIREFNNYPNDIDSTRKVPIGYPNIIKYLKRRNAFNHMAVIFRKSAILAVGGYKEIHLFEDYDLWIRLVQAGYRVDNLEEVLVYVRIGNNMIGRRCGFDYAKKEIRFLYRQKNNHFISTKEFIKLLFLRIPMRFIPTKLLTFIYFYYLRKD